MHVLEHQAAPRATVDASVVARTREIFRSTLELDVPPTMDVIDADLLEGCRRARAAANDEDRAA
jgi:hypothetical protein